VVRFVVPLGEGQLFNANRQALSISPDGTHIAYTANQGLYLRSLADLEAKAIVVASGQDSPVRAVAAKRPFWFLEPCPETRVFQRSQTTSRQSLPWCC
jgi:hypothetical protein